MLEPGYDAEKACKARLNGLFKKAMPGKAPPPPVGGHLTGVEHHEDRVLSAFGALDALSSKTSSRSEPQAGMLPPPPRALRPCDGQSIFLEKTAGPGSGGVRGGGKATLPRGKEGRLGQGKGGARPGFVKFNLDLRQSMPVPDSGSVIGFLNTIRESKGKRKLDACSEDGYQFGAKRRPHGGRARARESRSKADEGAAEGSAFGAVPSLATLAHLGHEEDGGQHWEASRGNGEGDGGTSGSHLRDLKTAAKPEERIAFDLAAGNAGTGADEAAVPPSNLLMGFQEVPKKKKRKKKKTNFRARNRSDSGSDSPRGSGE